MWTSNSKQNIKEKIFNHPTHSYTKELMNLQFQIKENKKIDDRIVLKVENLKVWYPIKKGLLKKTVNYVKAIENLDLNLNERQTIGIVGESGSVKTSLKLEILKFGHKEYLMWVNLALNYT